MEMQKIVDHLLADLAPLTFAEPVTHVYNPLLYARNVWDEYVERYGAAPKEVVLFGMNPGPWGMVQTGVPFGEVTQVRDWLGLEAVVGKPANEHPKRPVLGFSTHRKEVSGQRFWGWARETFGTPERFFARFFVANYCPLAFLEASGRNRTPDKLPMAEREPLLAACDRALRATIDVLRPQVVVGIGRFARARAEEVLADKDVRVGSIPHPSPASPLANRGWSRLADEALTDLGISVPGDR